MHKRKKEMNLGRSSVENKFNKRTRKISAKVLSTREIVCFLQGEFDCRNLKVYEREKIQECENVINREFKFP